MRRRNEPEPRARVLHLIPGGFSGAHPPKGLPTNTELHEQLGAKLAAEIENLRAECATMRRLTLRLLRALEKKDR
jgi:hypothetical protein